MVGVRRHYTFIILDVIMPNSDFKYYTVGVVLCNSPKKYQLLQMISCCHKIFYHGPHLFCSAAVRLGDYLASGIVLAIFMDQIVFKIYIFMYGTLWLRNTKNLRLNNVTITKINSEIGGLVVDRHHFMLGGLRIAVKICFLPQIMAKCSSYFMLKIVCQILVHGWKQKPWINGWN